MQGSAMVRLEGLERSLAEWTRDLELNPCGAADRFDFDRVVSLMQGMAEILRSVLEGNKERAPAPERPRRD